MAAGASLQYGPTDAYGVAHGAPNTTMSAPSRRSTVAGGSPRNVSSSVALNIEPRLAIATAWSIRIGLHASCHWQTARDVCTVPQQLLAIGGTVGRIRRVGSFAALAVLAVSTIGVVAVPSAHAVGGTITGVVRDTSGVPIAGATVFTQVQANSFSTNLSAVTDASGNYSITGLAPATWKVGAFANGFAGRWGNASTLDAGASVVITAAESQQFDVVLPRKTATISGTITDPSGNPVAGGTVNLVNRGSILPSFLPGFQSSGYFASVLTDANGHYVITNLAPSPFTVSFSALRFDGGGPPDPNPFLDEWYPDQRTEATATRIELVEGQETAGIDAQLDLGATITGRVTDQDGNPIAAAGVTSSASVVGPGAVTDANGIYTLVGVPPGDLSFVLADF